MGDYGKVGITAGYSRVNVNDYAKVGAEYTYQNSFKNNSNIGYKLACNGNALIGKDAGFSAGAYAGLDFGKNNCTQYNLGLMADYTFAGSDKVKYTETTKSIGDIKIIDQQVAVDNYSQQALRAGGELGFTRNICCDDDKKLHIAVQGGAEFTSKLEPDMNNTLAYSKNLNKVKPFIGAAAEFSQKVNDKGNELYFKGSCQYSDLNSKGEFGIGFRF